MCCRENPGPLGRFYNKMLRRDLFYRARIAPNAAGVKQLEDGHIASVQKAGVFHGSGRCALLHSGLMADVCSTCA